MKLKTLKELTMSWNKGDVLVSERKLKEEAIKWIKELLIEGEAIYTTKNKDGFKNREEAGKNLRNVFLIEGKIAWIIDFFNITEEELK